MRVYYFYPTLKRRNSSFVLVLDHGQCELLDPRHDLWLYGEGDMGFGSGVCIDFQRQAALALLSDALESDDLAVALHEEFASEVLRFLPACDNYSIPLMDVILWYVQRTAPQVVAADVSRWLRESRGAK